MKKLFVFCTMVCLLVSLVGCNNDQRIVDDINPQGVFATTTGYDSGATKVNFTKDLKGFSWSNGDCIGICRSGTAANGTAAFTLLKGGQSTGNFINDAFSLIPQTEYFAFYPFVGSATSTKYMMNLTGQVQEGNGSVSHIGPYNYMSAKFTTNDQSTANFTFSNLCSVIQVHFAAEGNDTYKSMTIQSDRSNIAIHVQYDLTEDQGLIIDMTNTVTLSFGSGMTVTNGDDVTATMIMYPQDLGGDKLTFTVTGDNGTAKEFTLSGFAMVPGKLYHYYESESHASFPYGGCKDENHPHAVDLGLPSGTLWACCDLGAEKPWEFGSYNPWGETPDVTKNSSEWSNYKFMTDSYNYWTGISKYQLADESYEGIWYNADSTFVGDNKSKLEPNDDAVQVRYWGSGSGWRMPTKEEADELINYTYRVEVEDYNGTGQSGHILYKKKSNGVYSLSDTHIFIAVDKWSYSGHYYPISTMGDVFWTSELETTKDAKLLILGDYPSPDRERKALHRIRAVKSSSK